MKRRHIPFIGLCLCLFAPQALALTCQIGGVSPSNPDSAYTDQGDGTVTDNRTDLMWDQCTWGLSGSDCASGSAGTYDWQQAFGVADTANAAIYKGYDDWRLPNIKELESLTEECRRNPAINDSLFPNTPSWAFWSSSPYADHYGAWYVYFRIGGAYGHDGGRNENFHVRLVRGGQSFDAFDKLGDVTAPSLSGVGVTDTTGTATTLATTSDEDATGYWMAVARDATAPSAAQVKAGADYGGVAVVASGSGSMTAATEATFNVTGLSAGTAYDLYLVAQDGSSNANFSAVAKVPFSTLVNSYAISVSANPLAGGSPSCTPNPVDHGASSSCSANASAGYSFTGWSGDCSGSSCKLTNVTAAKSVTANFSLNSYAITTAASPSAGGSAGCSPNPVDHGSSSSCSATANAGYSFTGWGGDCSGSDCELTNVTAAKSVTAGFEAVTSYTGPAPTGTGDVTLEVAGPGCALTSAQLVPAPAGMPANMAFPHGLADFTLSGCTGEVTVTLTYPEAIPFGATYYKEKGGVYTEFPATIDGNTVSFTLIDNGTGDSDPASGVIRDPSGVAVAAAAAAGAQAIPAMGLWSLGLLSGLLGLLGMWWRRSAFRLES